ncbi:hypothetical protein DICPUDRAFT_155867 [Dictyostelium purpureum]|uniref:BEACH domain-containing protein n=1 Tax=Dictyostelium purpureum TaxID=5786 RepID=F0ZV35_DICPU|nr:uncharacterized protein DICPUDRAFT_155867 [Dictyostelium purpureum]EGC32207.1 hypothetical protein DICPUDRAFT_155867 [Dictyostelium purpureum]|eukprot:XP_003291279.1 hypothetical protein DICPUDRAFT_155867 [Dictyostelium purpureum]
MFRKFKDLVVGNSEETPQQHHSPSPTIPQYQSNIAVSPQSISSPSSSSSLSSISSPPSRNYSANEDLHNHHQQQQQHQQQQSQYSQQQNNILPFLINTNHESKNVWLIMKDSEVEQVKSTANIQKLKSLWQDFLSSKSDKDKVMKLNKLLPNFISLYEDKKIDIKNNMIEVFGNNSRAFSFAVSRRLVKDINEIYKQSQQSKENAAKEIYKFFSTCSGQISGFELLYSVEILSESPTSCDAMSEASVPSMLVRCLQSLFLVPYPTLEQTKGVIEDKLIRTLCFLSKQKSAIEELQKTDTLSILFSLMTNDCQSTHRPLRAKIGSFGHEFSDLHPPTITYINSKKVIGNMINDLNNYFMFTPETYISICKIIVKILAESSKKSTILLDEFLRNEGYSFLVQSLFRLESSKDKPHLFDYLLDSISHLIYVGYGNINIPDHSPVPYQSSIQNLKEISNQNYIAKNGNAFKVLEQYFLKSSYEENRVKILDKILSIYSSNPVNFILLQHTNTLTKLIQDYESLSNDLKYHIMKIVCFVVTVLNCVPFQELSTFSLLVSENPSKYTLDMIYQLITTLVNFEFRYKHIFRETGLLDILVKVIDITSQDIIRYNHKKTLESDQQNIKKNSEEEVDLKDQELNSIIKIDSFQILLDSLYILIAEHPDNISLIRSFSIFNVLLQFLPYSLVRSKSLQILQQLIKYDPEPTQKEFDGLIKVLTSVNNSNYPMKTDILNSIRKLFSISKHARDSFREHGGFVSIISVISGLESIFTTKTEGESRNWDMEKLELIEAICRCTTSALCGNSENREIFEQQIGYRTFSFCLVNTGVFKTEFSRSVVDFIFDMVTENLKGSDHPSTQMVINNVESFNVILDIIPHITNPDFILQIISRINRMAEYGRFNQEALSKLSIPDWILQKFPSNLSNAKDPLQPVLLSLIQTVGANCLSGSELRQFVKLLQPEQSPEVLLKILSSMAKSSPMPPYFEFNLSKVPFGYIRTPIPDRAWPPTNGYTIMFWLYIEKFGTGVPGQQPIDLVHIYSEDKKSSLYIYLKNGFINVNIINSSKYVIEIPAFKFEESKWYHIGIVHARRLLGGTDFKLFVDGFLKYTATKAQYPAQISSGSQLLCDVGVANQNRFEVDQIWRIGPFYVLDESLGSKHINTIYFLGPNYASNFKGRFSPYQTYEIINSANLTAIKDLDYGDALGPLNLAKISMQIDENRIMVGLCASNKHVRTNNSSKVIYNEIYNNIINDLSQPGTPNLYNSSISGLVGNSHQLSNASQMMLKKELEGRTEIINQADLTTKQRAILSGSVEAFRRNKVADSIKKIGGMPIALLLLEKANTPETLYDSLGLLVGLVQYHPTNTHEMSQINGYELLSWVLKKKAEMGLFNDQIVELLFDLIGMNGNTLHSARNPQEGTVANWNACKYVMMNWEIWKLCSSELEKYVINGYNGLIANNIQKRFNIDNLRKLNIIQEIFDILSGGIADQQLNETVASSVIGVLYNILSHGGLIEDDIRQISAFLISHLHQGLISAKRKSSYRGKLATMEFSSSFSNQMVNHVFYTFLKVVANCQDPSVIFKRVSSYWCFFFIDENLPPLTVSLALRVTCMFFLFKYDYCSSFIKKSGFKIFEKILPSFSGYQEIYLCLLHLLLGSDPKQLVDLDLGGPLVFHELLRIFTPNEKNLYCIEAAQLILSIIKRSYEENYQYCEQQLQQQLQQQNQQNETDELLSTLISASSLNQNNGNTSPLATSQTISPSLSSSSSGVQQTQTQTQNQPQHGFVNKVGNLWNKFEEKTLEFAVATGALEDIPDAVVQGKKKRASLQLSQQQQQQLQQQQQQQQQQNLQQSSQPTSYQQQSQDPSISNVINNYSEGLPELKLSQYASPEVSSNLQYTMLTYFIYLFHENVHFQQECYTQAIVEELISILFPNGKLNLPALSANQSSTSGGIKDRVLDLVVKFLCQIVLSAMRKTSKAISIIEMVLESTPTNISDDEFILYHSRILIDLMYVVETNITKTEFFDNERVHSNLIKLCSMLVDNVNLDQLVKNNKTIISKRVFLFIVKILEKLEADRVGLKTVQPIYRSLNRIILFLANNTSDTDLQFVTNHIINHQRIIFSENNLDNEFVFALCYSLYKHITSDQHESVECANKLWRLLLTLKSSSYIEYVASVLQLKVQSSTNPRQTELIDLKPGFEILASRDISDFKNWMDENITTIAQVFEEAPKKAHLNTQNNEKRQAVEHTLTQFKVRRSERITKKLKQEKKDQLNSEEKHRHISKKAQFFVKTEGERRKKIRQLENDKQKFNAIQWENMRAQITRERAVWGPPEPHSLDKWKLDSTEGPYRMRKKMEKNYNFYKNYPYVPQSFDEHNSSLLPIPCSADSERYMNIVGTEEANLLEPSYWKFDLLSTNQVITSSTGIVSQTNQQGKPQQPQQETISISQSSSLSSQQLINNSGTQTTTTTNTTLNVPNKSTPDSPLSKSSSVEFTPPTSPIQSSDDYLKSPKISSSLDSKDELTNSELFNDTSSIISELSINSEVQPSSQPQQRAQTPQQQNPQTGQPQQNEIDEESSTSTTSEDETQAFIRLLDPYDQSYLKDAMRKDPRLNGIMYNCGSVDGMDKIEGILIFCPVYMYIFDGYQKESTGEISEVEEKINSEWLPEGSALPQKKKIIHYFLKWAYEDIRDILKRRYLLRQVALEIFSTDGRNNLIVYKDEPTRDEVYHTLVNYVSTHNTIGGDAQGITGAQTGDDMDDRGMKDRFTSIWRKSPLTLKWQQGQISNFQYLMHLNTLAGRSYNDLTQYPVFPWVLCDYESEELDIDDPKVYRDLSKPMGALQESRAQKFRERFENWDDQEPNEHGHKVPKFHYGTHYSSAAIVLYYLIRLEPFTQHFLKLQGGRWDQADRLFSSITEAWSSSSQGSTGVVMELIPEFYYLPEFLQNTNKFNFGTKQGGEAIDDVFLPPWAKGSPTEFIKLHRKALESDYVSEHLHEWIDLIFGYKQQGKGAEDSLNVFYYLTYEGAVNIDAITDPVEKAATIAQINNFGQTPKQLFDKPHPKRNSALIPLPFYAKPLVGNFIKDIGEPVGQIRLINDRATCVGFNKVLLPPNHSKYILWGLPDGSIRYNTGDKIKVLEDHHDGPPTCLTTTEDGRICVSGGSDSLICVFNLKRFSLAKRLNGHTGPITCVAASRPYSVIVSGSDDRTCIIWDLNRLCYVRSLVGHDGPISCISINDQTGDILVCSGTTINIYTINGELCISHKTSQITNDQITTCIWSKGQEWLGENVFLTGHRDGKLKIWAMETRLQPDPATNKLKFKNVIILRATFHNSQVHNTAITSIFLTNDQQKFYLGDIVGKVSLWMEESNQSKQRNWNDITINPIRGILSDKSNK